MGGYKPPMKFNAIFARVICLYFALGILYLLSIIMPTKRTHFRNYQVYLDNRTVRGSYGPIFFEEDLPIGAKEIKYYSEHVIAKYVTAYSIVLPEDTYIGFRERRINFYVEESDRWKSRSLLYALQGDEHQYIDDSEWYEIKLDYMDNVLHCPEARQQYYFGVIMKTNTVNGECYTGIIANDSDCEIIEFSANLPEDYGEHKEPERHYDILDWIQLSL